MTEDDEDEDDDNNISDWAHTLEVSAFEDKPMDEVEENAAEEQPPDGLCQVLLDA